MIVKNESKIITRLLLSALPIIDTYCICDTGSTDNTVELITDFFKRHNISGKIVTKPFVNFGVNRTFAYNEAKGMADYALLLDADMVLKIGAGFKKSDLTKDIYSIIQKSGGLSYYNVRLAALRTNLTVRGPTHEYYDIHGSHTSDKLPEEILHIADIGDGGSKSDKFERDIRLFKEALVDEPNNCRYYFYLGNSYFDAGKRQEAIPYYEKRIALGGWDEEIFYSHLRIGHCYRDVDETKMVHHWLTAYQIKPTRAETLYELTKYYREKGQHHKSWLFYNTAKDIPYPKNDVLFIHQNVYDYELLYEYSIIAYYLGHRNISNVFFQLFRKMPITSLYSLFGNYRFYKYILQNPTITVCMNATFDRTINGTRQNFSNSSPSIFPYKNGYGVNLRCVSYKITPNGRYEHCTSIITINKFIEFTREFKKTSEYEFPLNATNTCIHNNSEYIGIEDVKVVSYGDQLYYTGTCCKNNGKIGVCGGKYTQPELEYIEYSTAAEKDTEKNWVYVPGKTRKMIYKWHPLTVGDLSDDGKLEIKQEIATPALFSLARGSTNGFIYKNEIWFIVHYAYLQEGEARHYFHNIVVCDLDLKILRYTIPFKFVGEPIEYCLGMVVEDDRVLISHSLWDREAYIKVYPKEYMDSLFHNE